MSNLVFVFKIFDFCLSLGIVRGLLTVFLFYFELHLSFGTLDLVFEVIV